MSLGVAERPTEKRGSKNKTVVAIRKERVELIVVGARAPIVDAVHIFSVKKQGGSEPAMFSAPIIGQETAVTNPLIY